ncbi:MAG: AMP-binding protein [Deltaproteobacteria bacterium]|nr:AMP-binding protein [Deltaproteobacteria bacterium]
MIITEILTENAKKYGNKTALIELEPAIGSRREITWKQFNKKTNKAANALRAIGIEKQDKVIQLMTNSMEWLPIYFGILKSGALAVPLNFRFFAEKIKKCAQISEAKAIFFGKEFIERIESIKNSLDKIIKTYIFTGGEDICPSYAISYEKFIANAQDNEPNEKPNIEDDAAIYFTSGTTGLPKAVLLTHKNLESACITEQKHHHQTNEDNFLCIPPLYHTGAKMHWFGNFIAGAKSVLLKGVKPEWILNAISEEKITIVWLLVPWAHDILIALENKKLNLKDYDASSLRLMHIGAQPVPPTLIKKWMQYFPNRQYDTDYGLTESTGPGCVHLGMENTRKVGAIGLAGYKWNTKIVDDNGKQIAADQIGELLVKGPGVMKQYYKNPEETKKALKNEWLYTGDLAKKDKDGFIWLVDRKKDLVITGGENIYPVEIENFLMTNNKIKDAAVIGIHDDRLGEIAAAIIEAKPNYILVEEEIKTFCEKLPRYKRPRKIFFDKVPRNPTGKIEKPELRKKYAKHSSVIEFE